MAEAIIEGKAAYAEANGENAEEVSAGEMEAIMSESEAEDKVDAAATEALAEKKEAPAIETEATMTEEEAEDKVDAAATEALNADDLTKIAGVGKVYQGKLNDEGFHTFSDVANMTDAQIEVMEEKYSFKGNFRDAVASAKELAEA